MTGSAIPESTNLRGEWFGYDRFEGGKFVAGFLLDQDQEPELREVARFNARGIAERVGKLLAAAHRLPFQKRVAPWMEATFGAEVSANREERNHRFLEEAIELVQANGCSASEAHQLVDYVFGRPIGEPSQEVGGVMVTLAALCLASGLDMHEAAETELTRIWTKVEQIRAKQAAKPKHSPLPVAVAAGVGGYQMAFYELAKLMGIGARSEAPGQVWRKEMLPRLLRIFAAERAASEIAGEAGERARVLALCDHVERFSYERMGIGPDASPHLLSAAVRRLLAGSKVQSDDLPKEVADGVSY